VPPAAVGIGAHRRDDDIGATARGDVELAAVYDIAILDALGHRLERCHVAAAARFGNCQRRHPLARQHLRHVALFLRLAAQEQNRWQGNQVAAESNSRSDRASVERQRFTGNNLVSDVAATAAVLDGKADAKDAGGRCCRVQLAGKLGRFFPGLGMWGNGRLGKACDLCAQRGVLLTLK
jgi:hypothetical protein